MKIHNEQDYEAWLKLQTDSYSLCAVRFLTQWADLMEARLDKGEDLSRIHHECATQADTEGITGAMYGVAVGALARFWVHGKNLPYLM